MSDLLSDAETNPPEESAKDRVKRVETDDGITLDYFGESFDSPEDLVASLNYDPAIWYIAEKEIKQHGVAGKLRQGQNEQGRWLPEKLWQQTIRNIHVKLRRRAPRPIQEGVLELIRDFRPLDLPPIVYPPIEGERFLCELSLYDVHIGKLCWGVHTGTDYDVELAIKAVRNVVIDLLRRVRPFPVERFLVPLGHDWFHTDNWQGTTESGTVVDSTDDRGPQLFQRGTRLAAEILRMLRPVAPVHVVYVRDNHGPSTAWHMLCVLEEIFRDDPHVTFDLGPQERKYFDYGPALIGMAHGHGLKLDKLPLLMAVEAPEQWAKAKHRHIHTGHFHKKAKTVHQQGDTFNGVEVWTLPSLSGTDAWHYAHGFVGNVRAAEAYLWSNQEGYAGHFSVNARSDRMEAHT